MNKKELNVVCLSEKDINENFTNSDDYNNGINIDKINYFKLKHSEMNLTILVFMSSKKKYMVKCIKKLVRYRKILATKFNSLKIILINYDSQNQIHYQFKELLPTIYSSSIDLIYDKAYDLACDYLDSFFYGKNLCDFCNNKCGYRPNFELDCGCCRHFEKHKQLGLLFGEKLTPCEKLGSDGHCTIKCMRCKLFSCAYLNKKGINFNTGSIFSLYSIFNPVQRLILNMIAYTDKPDVLKIVKIFR